MKVTGRQCNSINQTHRWRVGGKCSGLQEKGHRQYIAKIQFTPEVLLRRYYRGLDSETEGLYSTEESSCLWVQRAGTKGVHHNTQINLKSIFFLVFKKFLHVLVFSPHVCPYITCMHAVSVEARELWTPLEMQLQMVVTHHVGTEDWTRNHWRSSLCS